MPEKTVNFGIKFWMVFDATTYFVRRTFPYAGKEDREVDLAEHVTGPLMESYKNATTNNFFTFFSLTRNLLQSSITMVGTIRAQ